MSKAQLKRIWDNLFWAEADALDTGREFYDIDTHENLLEAYAAFIA